MCKPDSPHPQAQWEFPVAMLELGGHFQINFRPQKEIKAILGEGQTIHSGPYFATLRYILWMIGPGSINSMS